MEVHRIQSKYGTGRIVPDFVGRQYKSGDVAVLGQDSGITTRSEVNSVLMLDDRNSNLFRYISNRILGRLGLSVESIVAFNLISTDFSTSLRKIAKREGHSLNELVFYFARETSPYFLEKLDRYRPKYLITLGEPVFRYLSRETSETHELKDVFATVMKLSIKGRTIVCIPCVHMTTYNTKRRHYGAQDHRLERLKDIM